MTSGPEIYVAGQALWLAQTNCYVVAAERGGMCVIVDAPPDIPAIEALVRRHDLTPVALLTTHGHIDHAGGAGAARGYGIDTYLHPDDEFLALDPGSQLSMLFGSADPAMVEACSFPSSYERLEHGMTLTLAGMEIRVVHTPGHTPGHCCFVIENDGIMFSGDQLFAGSIGRTDLPGGDFGALMRSMAERVLVYADATAVLPGHGPATTIGAERRTNPFLRQLAGS